ncbi:MAG: sigma-70 family RNA polymerase sigma factor [Actinobacteria bacterium]|uniref:Unannotated protein n=1 Tax=freshwater metagenome TaxID=449393 RepID=A0A6J7CKW5_9ZZZZ|nr:sigma-70 family RNA polymerase sigma factor [Actinomycetota bacterium]
MTGVGGSSRWTDEHRAQERALFIQLAQLRTSNDDPGGSACDADELRAVRDALITMHLGLVHYLAKRHSPNGGPADDLVQAGTLGLIAAVDGFDVGRGTEFSTYAAKHIEGAMRAFFRTDSWALYAPRRVRDLNAAINRARGELSASLGRPPTVTELSLHLDVSPEEIIESLEAVLARTASSIDTPIDADGRTLADTVGFTDTSFEAVENREAAASFLSMLDDRERRIVMAHFLEGRSQQAISEDLGISQVHVSRLLRASVEQMRRGQDGWDGRIAPP